MSVRYWDSHRRSLKTEKRSHATSPDYVEGVGMQGLIILQSRDRAALKQPRPDSERFRYFAIDSRREQPERKQGYKEQQLMGIHIKRMEGSDTPNGEFNTDDAPHLAEVVPQILATFNCNF
ncbi:hypothetical protein Bbelb_355760 [Branchiostoma belcheri]|nr:hypothetical protein Bbelb_355760 [Branchiostoma belcheri]